MFCSACFRFHKRNIVCEQHTNLRSDYSFNQTALVSSTSGLFSFPQTEPSTDLLDSSSWATTVEGTQNFQDFPDDGSAHSGEPEEYLFTSGHTTPRGTRLLENAQANEANWAPSSRIVHSAAASGQAMSRTGSTRSNVSLSQLSQMSNMDVRGNVAAFRNGSQAPTMVGMDSCLLLDTHAANAAPQVYWPDYSLDVNLGADNVPFGMSAVSPLHIVPSQMQLGPDASLPDTSSPGSWECFSSSISRTSSPATIDDTWLSAPLSPHSSPEIKCQSPRYVSMQEGDAAAQYSNRLSALIAKFPFFRRTSASPSLSWTTAR
jgi:hypothetical protein